MAEGPTESAVATSSVDHAPSGDRWSFDEGVTDVFDDMLRRSIPLHQVMRDAVVDVAVPFIRPGGLIVDLGAARGEAIATVLARAPFPCHGLAAEVSAPMLAALDQRFAGPDTQPVDVVRCDLRDDYPLQGPHACVTLCVLTAQFVPIEYRQRVLADAYGSTIGGGAIVFVEKVLGQGPAIDSLFVDLYLARKEANGYSREAIERKRLSLEGVLVPLTPSANVGMLHDAGWRHVDCFWRWMNFAGWIGIKEA